MENPSFIVTEQLSNTSDKEVEEMRHNWCWRICVVSFSDSVGIMLGIPRQQTALPAHTPISLFPEPSSSHGHGTRLKAHSSGCFRTPPTLHSSVGSTSQIQAKAERNSHEETLVVSTYLLISIIKGRICYSFQYQFSLS